MTDVQRPADPAITHILVPVDGSGCALHACRRAAELARRLEARLTLCCVSDDLRTISTLVATSQDVVGEFLEILAVEARTALRRALAEIDDIGFFSPQMISAPALGPGEVGFVITGIN